MLDILEELINCDDDDDELTLTRSDSFRQITDQVKQVIQRVVSLGSVEAIKVSPLTSHKDKNGGQMKGPWEDDESEGGAKGLGAGAGAGAEDKDGYMLPSEWADFK